MRLKIFDTVAMDIEEDESDQKGSINRHVLSEDLVAGRITKEVKADGTSSLEKNYYHLDHLNSTTVVTDKAGDAVVNYTYRAFGKQLKCLDKSNAPTKDLSKYSYGGKELDGDINLYYFDARFYDATMGRFINVDPVQDGTNWYAYVSNNPLSFIDPTGLETHIFSISFIGKHRHLFIAVKDTEGNIQTQSLYPKNRFVGFMTLNKHIEGQSVPELHDGTTRKGRKELEKA